MCSPASNITAPPFCDAGMSMTMHMDGFRSSFFAYLFPSNTPPPPTGGTDENTPPCLNFLFRNWTLDTPTKFAAAMVGVILLGIAAEGMAAARSGGMVHRWARRLAHTLAQCCCCVCGSSGGTHGGGGERNRPAKCQRHIVKLCLLTAHVLQALVGYILMLAAMTYSLELLGCVLVGLGVGYAAFFELDGAADDADGNGDGGDGDGDGDDSGYNGGADGGGSRADGYEEIADRQADYGRVGDGERASANDVPEGAATCCDFGGGRGPPRRAFQFLRSPVPTIDGIGVGNRRIASASSSGGGVDGRNIDSNNGEAGNNGAGADNLSLHEDDKMTPLL